MEIVLASNFSRDERLGSARVPLRLAVELEHLGVQVTSLFAEDLLDVPKGRVDQLSAPFRIASAVAKRARHADVVDIAGFDAWAYAAFARRLRPRQAVVSRSNGLWYRALEAEGRSAQSPARRLASQLYQSQVLCRWERASMRRADLVLFGARGDRDEIVANGWQTSDRIAVVAPGVDDFFASDVPLDRRADIAVVGTFMHRKGNDVVADAMSRVLVERPGIGLTLFGPGLPAAEVLARFDEGARARITIVPSVPSTELARRLGTFAVLLFPTRYEGFGMVVLEAMRAGLAVVTTPTGCGMDVVRDGENGLIVPIGAVAPTASAVCRLVDDPALRIRLATAAVEEARARTWGRTARELVAAYERAVAFAAGRAAPRGSVVA